VCGIGLCDTHFNWPTKCYKSKLFSYSLCHGNIYPIPFFFSYVQSYRDLSFVSKDGLALVLNYLTQLVVEKFPRLLDSVRSQLMWLIKELVRANVTGTDTLIWNLMRQIAGGDVTPKNIWLAESLMDMLADQRLISKQVSKFDCKLTLFVFFYH